MNVYYSHDIFASQPYGGISRYYSELVRGFGLKGSGAVIGDTTSAAPNFDTITFKTDVHSEESPMVPARNIDAKILAGLHINAYLKNVPGVYGLKVPTLPHTRFLRFAANEIYQEAFLKKAKAGIFHKTYFFGKPKASRHALVVTAHDMIHELFKDSFPENDPTTSIERRFYEAADHIIAVSQSTKNDLMRLYNIDPKKVTVVHHGVPTLLESPDKNFAPGETLGGHDLRPYLLFIGSRHGYKNFVPALQAFAHSPSLKKEFRWVCMGAGPFNVAEKKSISELGLENQVKHAEGGDFALSWYYKNAHALIYPSVYEGFGLPLLEAMKFNCPVICAATSSLPEIGGDAAIYFNPKQEGDLKQVLEKNLFSEENLNRARLEGQSRLNLFSWEKASAETAQVYMKMGKSDV